MYTHTFKDIGDQGPIPSLYFALIDIKLVGEIVV